MDSPARPQQTPTHREGSRFNNAQIRQEGSQFGATQVKDGSVFQGNFVGLTFSERILPTLFWPQCSQHIDSTSAAYPDYAGHFAHSTLAPVNTYVPRNLLHDQIKIQLCNHVADENTKIVVVWGPSGAGKTQLVLDYVQQHRTEYKGTFWIEAGQKESLERDFVHLYKTLFGLQIFAGAGTAAVEDAVTGVKSWFSRQRGPWLIVFDDANTFENEEASGCINIRHFIPNSASLHVIVTSRSSTARNMTRLDGVQVGEMEEAEAAELFFQTCHGLPRDNPAAKDDVLFIVKKVGYQARAVMIAAVYVGSIPGLQSDIEAWPEARRLKKLVLYKGRMLCEEYPGTITEISDFAVTLRDQGQLDEAAEMFKEVLEKRKRVLGKEHPDTITAISDLAATIRDQGQLDEAAEMLKEVLEKRKRVLGKEHPDTITAISDLAATIRAQGQLDKAAKMFKEVLKKRKRNLGEDHPGTITAIRDLAATLRAQGQLDEAAEMFKEVLEKSKQIFGEEHPNTITAISNLAATIRDQGQLDEAAEMFKKVLEKRKRNPFIEDYPDTITAISDLAATLRAQGQLDEAAEMFKEMLEKSKQFLSEDHPNKITAISNLAATLRDQGQLDEAAEMFKGVLEKMKQNFGEEHPQVKILAQNVAEVVDSQKAKLQIGSNYEGEGGERDGRRGVAIDMDGDVARVESNSKEDKDCCGGCCCGCLLM
jgi:tetratricopeptide (TPR) repeat protein